ncbi:MAG: hydrogenase maturation nickel metallochaperone HypA [Phycisphaerae bacterium]|nr:hydrogenase maturation nickel metallochaperone HypA [Phycisphaerae bacterium]
MHEAAVAQSIFDTVMAEAQKQKGKPTKAKITCGTFDAVNEEILAFAFSVIAKDTVAKDMKIGVEQKPVMALCRHCKKEFKFDVTSPSCVHCDSNSYNILPDPPLILEQIIFETD